MGYLANGSEMIELIGAGGKLSTVFTKDTQSSLLTEIAEEISTNSSTLTKEQTIQMYYLVGTLKAQLII